MDYTTIMNLWYYDMQNIMDNYSRILEERNEAEEKKANEQGIDTIRMNPKSIMNSAKSLMPKMPKVNIPNL